MTWGGRVAGLLLGLVVASGLAIAATPGRGPAMGFDLKITAIGAGEVGVAPSGMVMSARALRPGASVSSRMVLRNHTDALRAVRPHVDGGLDLDRHLRVELRDGARELYRGPLRGLRLGWGRALMLRPLQARAVTLRAWVSRGSAWRQLQGRVGSLTLRFRSRDPA